MKKILLKYRHIKREIINKHLLRKQEMIGLCHKMRKEVAQVFHLFEFNLPLFLIQDLQGKV